MATGRLGVPYLAAQGVREHSHDAATDCLLVSGCHHTGSELDGIEVGTSEPSPVLLER